MGMFDSVWLDCPSCGEKYEAQSKGGDCLLRQYTLENVPENVLSNINRHAPFTCNNCGTQFFVFVKKVGKVEFWDFYNH